MVEDIKTRPREMPMVLHDSDAADPLTAPKYTRKARSGSLRSGTLTLWASTALADAAGDYVLWEALAVSMLPFVMRRSGFDFANFFAPFVATLVGSPDHKYTSALSKSSYVVPS
jgi:hypothetical protein